MGFKRKLTVFFIGTVLMLLAVMNQYEIANAQLVVRFLVFQVMIDQQRQAQQLTELRTRERKNQQEQYVHTLVQQGEFMFFSDASFLFGVQHSFFPE